MDADERQKKHDAYARRADPATLVLAFVFLVVWSARTIWTGMDPGLSRALFIVQGWIWLAFIADIVIRLVWSGSRWRWLWTHPIDLIAVALPPARPLKILTTFTQGALLGGARRALKTSQAVLVSAVLLMWIGAVSTLGFERGHQGANIVDFPDALWWSLVSVTTVGYGDFYPVTTEGRIVALVLMLVGISLIGVITASVAAWFVSLTADQEEAREEAREDVTRSQLLTRIDQLETKLDAIANRDGASASGLPHLSPKAPARPRRDRPADG